MLARCRSIYARVSESRIHANRKKPAKEASARNRNAQKGKKPKIPNKFATTKRPMKEDKKNMRIERKRMEQNDKKQSYEKEHKIEVRY